MSTNNMPLSAKQLLLVDDDRLVLATMAGGLKHAGYRVSTAESAEDAEAWLASGDRPDLVVLDVHMSGHDGLHLAQRLRELDHIPFMMLSAYSDPHLVEQTTRDGALAYAVKPLDVAQLVPAIEAALARANELQILRTTREQLQAALDRERDINIAVGITMMQYRLKRSDAFELLRTTARSKRCKLAAFAAEVIKTYESMTR